MSGPLTITLLVIVSASVPLKLVSVTVAVTVLAAPPATVSVAGVTPTVKALVFGREATTSVLVTVTTPGTGLFPVKSVFVAPTMT